MNAISIIPDSHEEWLALRDADVTSTEAAALFDQSPYESFFEFWHRKNGDIQSAFKENERVVWGKRLELAIAEGVAKDEGWKIRPMTEYMRIEELRMGSSFDYAIGDDGLLEVKNVDSLQFKDTWLIDDDGNIEAPVHIEFQCQHELAVSGRKYVVIAALIGGNKIKLIRRERDETIIKAIMIKVKAFWETIKVGKAPTPNFVEDSATIARMYGATDPGKLLEVGDDTAYKNITEQYSFCAKEEKAAKAQKMGCKAQLLVKMGTVEKVIGATFSISAGMTKESQVAYTRAPYRNFKVYERKVKK